MLGVRARSEFNPLDFLINNLNSAAWRDVAFAYLTELTRDPQVREAVYPSLDTGTKDEKMGLARALARSGDQETIAKLEKLSNDPDPEVAQEGLRAMRTLKR
jgi:ABC-type histidine transport system ATPase subunit